MWFDSPHHPHRFQIKKEISKPKYDTSIDMLNKTITLEVFYQTKISYNATQVIVLFKYLQEKQ